MTSTALALANGRKPSKKQMAAQQRSSGGYGRRLPSHPFIGKLGRVRMTTRSESPRTTWTLENDVYSTGAFRLPGVSP